MKGTLLTLASLVVAASANALVITEFAANPPGSDSTGTYIEIQGRANSTIAQGTRLVAINAGPGTAAVPGTVTASIDLGGLTFGTNGILLLKNGTATLQSLRPGSVTRAETFEGATVVSAPASDLIANDAVAVALVQGGTFTVGTDLDTNNDGILDAGTLTGVTVLDAVSYLANGDTNDPGQFQYTNGAAGNMTGTALGFFGGTDGWEPDFVYRLLDPTRTTNGSGMSNGWVGGDMASGAAQPGPYTMWDLANDEVAFWNLYGIPNADLNNASINPNWNYLPSPGFVNAPVPEPATMAVLGLGAAALLRRRRK